MAKFRIETDKGVFIIETEEKGPPGGASSARFGAGEFDPSIAAVDVPGGGLDPGEIPEFVGSAAGMLARKTVPGALLAGLGAGAGEAGRQIGQRLGVFEGEPPQTSGEAAKRIAFAGLRGGLGEVGGRFFGGILARKPGVTGGTAKAITRAEAQGLDLPLSARTESPILQSTEAFVERGLPESGFAVRRGKIKVLDQFNDIAEKFTLDIAPVKSNEAFSSLAENRLKAFKVAFTKTKDELYESTLPLVGKRKPQLSETKAVLQDIVERRSGLAEPKGLNEIRNWLKQIKRGQIKTFVGLRKFRTNVNNRGKFNDPATTGLQADIKDLGAAITRDLDATASRAGPDVAEGIRFADEFFAKGINRMKDTLTKRLQRTPANKMHEILIRPNSPEIAQSGKEILGEEVWRDVKRTWFNQLIENSRKSTTLILDDGTRRVEKVIDPKLLLNAWRKLGSTSGELFSPGLERDAMNEFIDTARLLSQVRPTIEGVSLGRNLAETVAGFFVDPFVTTQTGRQLLTTGFPAACVTLKTFPPWNVPPTAGKPPCVVAC